MAGLSPQGEAAVLAPLTSACYVSLHTADPGTAGGSEIVSDPSYARQGPVPFTNAGSEPTVASNSAIVAFPVATVAWGSVGFFGVWTAATGGAFQGSGVISPAKTVGVGDQMRFLVGALTFTAA